MEPLGNKRDQRNRRKFGAALLRWAGAQSIAIEDGLKADFFSMLRADVLRLTCEGETCGYAYRGRPRHVYRYLNSEVSADFEGLLTPARYTMPVAAPVSQRRKSNG